MMPSPANALVDVVAIDGPVGVGKSTVARGVADRLGFVHLDTGAMYRAVTWKYLQLPESERGEEQLAEIAHQLTIDMRADRTIWLDGIEITQLIRSEQVSRHVYIAADSLRVREALVAQQRRVGLLHPSVMEGRDISTVVFPDARWKIYLDASPTVRAERRLRQLDSTGQASDRAEVLRNLIERDQRDRTRAWGALKIADDATIIDTGALDEESVIRLICEYVRAYA